MKRYLVSTHGHSVEIDSSRMAVATKQGMDRIELHLRQQKRKFREDKTVPTLVEVRCLGAVAYRWFVFNQRNDRVRGPYPSKMLALEARAKLEFEEGSAHLLHVGAEAVLA